MSEFFGWLLGIDDIRNIQEGYAVIVTGLLIILGWYISGRQATDAFRRENAHTQMMHRKPMVQTYWKEMKAYNGRTVPTYDNLSAREEPIVREFVSEMEILGADISHGHTSEHYVWNTQKSLVTSSFRMCRDYISDFRIRHKSPDIGVNFELMYIRFTFGQGSFVTKSAEFILHRPLFGMSRRLFYTKYKLCRKAFGLHPIPILEDPVKVKRAFSLFNWLLYRPLLLVIAVLAALTIAGVIRFPAWLSLGSWLRWPF